MKSREEEWGIDEIIRLVIIFLQIASDNNNTLNCEPFTLTVPKLLVYSDRKNLIQALKLL